MTADVPTLVAGALGVAVILVLGKVADPARADLHPAPCSRRTGSA